MVLIFIYI